MAANDRWVSGDVLADATPDVRYHTIEARPGITLTHRFAHVTGTVTTFSEGRRVVLEDAAGRRHDFKPVAGVFEHNGTRVALRAPASSEEAGRTTASGSVSAPPERARVASPSRIWVEGAHDAELLEKIWGDDLRGEGVVVEPLHGADDLAAKVDAFSPTEQRRLGVLLDHLVPGSKESRIAAGITNVGVLICGHPYVDVWQAIKPQTIGIERWPEIPRGEPWKQGVIAALGLDHDAPRFWSAVLDAVSSYADLETPLINAVESLIDFVTVP